MAFVDEYDFHTIKNEAETIVIREVEQQLKSGNVDMCRCNDCVLDIVGVALNNVKPLYRVSLLGALYTSQAINEKEYADSVMKAVQHAIKKVKRNPCHD
jgi:competence protein ComFB